VGFESSHMARRRLAAAAMRHWRVQEALALAAPDAPALDADGPSFFTPAATPAGPPDSAWTAPALSGYAVPGSAAQPAAGLLEELAHDIVDTPGAGGALIAALADQLRVLRLVAEALARTPDRPLPAAVAEAVHRTLGEASHGQPLSA
jgi:hypothetical protein